MTIRPHDVTDLYLAPVALDLDTELGSLAGKSEHALLVYVALHTDREPSTIEERRTLLLAAFAHVCDVHDWRLSWDPRGLRISHDEHGIVLGVPREVRRFVEL